jgi:hypothetical protein
MAPEGFKRKLTSIFSAYVVGYYRDPMGAFILGASMMGFLFGFWRMV